jgi:hypothetical protein
MGEEQPVDVNELLASINANLDMTAGVSIETGFPVESTSIGQGIIQTDSVPTMSVQEVEIPKAPDPHPTATEERKVEDKFVVVRQTPMAQVRKSEVLEELARHQAVITLWVFFALTDVGPTFDVRRGRSVLRLW